MRRRDARPRPTPQPPDRRADNSISRLNHRASRATKISRHAPETFDIDGVPVRVAALRDIIRSKETANRLKDQAALPHLYALEDEIARLDES